MIVVIGFNINCLVLDSRIYYVLFFWVNGLRSYGKEKLIKNERFYLVIFGNDNGKLF